MSDATHQLFAQMLEASWQASLMAMLLLALHRLPARWLSARWRCALWGLVFLRLMLPAVPARPLSIIDAPPVATASPAMIVSQNVSFGVISDALGETISLTPTPAPPPIDWLRIASLAWASVAAVLILRIVLAAGRLSHPVRSLAPSTNPLLLAALNSAARESRVTPPPLVETDLVATPALAGLFRPRLLLPIGLAGKVSSAELRFIMLHELAHLRRRDVLIGSIAAIVTAVHWFNPIVWLAAARFRADRELACDAAVLALTHPADRISYGHAILRVLELSAATPRRWSAIAVGIIGSRRTLRRRIAAIPTAHMRSWSMLGPVLFIAVGCGVLTGPRQRAPSPSPAAHVAIDPSDPPGTITCAYDVRDLLPEIPNFTDAPQLGVRLIPTTGTAPPASQRAEAKTRAALVHDLIIRITSTIDPLSWKANTGKLGSVRESDGQLLITQTPENHEQIQRLFQELRGGRAVQITVETRFLTISKSAGRLLKRWGEPWSDVEGSEFQMWPRFLDESQASELYRAVQQDKNSSLITAPRITLANGQRAYVVVSRQTAYVADLKPAPHKPDQLDPVIGLIDSGVLVDCRAQVSDDHRFATLTLAPQLATLIDLVPQPWPHSVSGRGRESIIQVPHINKFRLNTTITMPDRKTVLYRVPITQQVETAPGRIKPIDANLLLMVKPTIIKDREPTTRPTPILDSRTPSTNDAP